MNLFLDFMNTKVWDMKSLFDLIKKHGFIHSQAGWELGYEEKFLTSAYPHCIFWLKEDDEDALKLAAVTDLSVLPGDPRYQGFFAYLLKLRAVWDGVIKKTITEGPEISFLNEITNHTRFLVSEGPTLWTVEVGNFWTDQSVFEDYLEADYLRVFLTGQGGLFKKLRTCQNEECSKWFVFNRPKQIYCCDKCRLAYHNSKNAKNEDIRKARAEKVRKGRAEGKYQ